MIQVMNLLPATKKCIPSSEVSQLSHRCFSSLMRFSCIFNFAGEYFIISELQNLRLLIKFYMFLVVYVVWKIVLLDD